MPLFEGPSVIGFHVDNVLACIVVVVEPRVVIMVVFVVFSVVVAVKGSAGEGNSWQMSPLKAISSTAMKLYLNFILNYNLS